MFIIHLDHLWSLFGIQLADLTVLIVHLMSHGQISIFSEKFFKFLFPILTAELSSLLMKSTKKDKVFQGRENGNH